LEGRPATEKQRVEYSISKGGKREVGRVVEESIVVPDKDD
jgi:hypothetical protein